MTSESRARFEQDGVSAETWYRIDGDLRPDEPDTPAPLVVLHGGPGCTHDYLLALADLAIAGHPVVLYDQIGNGRSTHFPDRGADFWTMQLFVQELHNLVESLGLGRHHVLGHSWGGFLAQEYALTSPENLLSLVLANTAASYPDFAAQVTRLRGELPPEVDDTLRRHEVAGTTDDPEYVSACEVFYRRHLCRVDPWPEEVVEGFAWIDRDPTVYHTMNGPSELHVIGSMREWQVKDRLVEIGVPTLLVSGRHDEATPALQETLLNGISGAEWVVFENSSHLPHVEERERYMRVVGDWLARHD